MKASEMSAPLAQPGNGFAWNNCIDEDISTRVRRKQQAVDDGLAYARQLCDQLRAGIDCVGDGHTAAFDLMGGNEIRAWIDEMKELERTSNDLEILIGVAGVTGAGKTSILNALLGFPRLLPSSSTEAATATVCRIAWNRDDTPGREFRADVIFRSEEDVLSELKDFLRAVQERKSLKEQEFENEQDRFDCIDEVNDIISSRINNVCAVWGLDDSELDDMDLTVESVLRCNDKIVDLLSKTKTIYSSNADEFATEVKPYLDSTVTPEGITAWPLIEEVRLYVKADMLQHGIMLVDLPGLSDTVESRAAVAERYYQKLSVTAIVTPAIRAVDEKTGVRLMGASQELRMQLDGKFHKDSFCVVVSKIDDVDCDTICRDIEDARTDTQLQADIAQIKSTSNERKVVYKNFNDAERNVKSMTQKRDKAKKKLENLRRATGSRKPINARRQKEKARELNAKRARIGQELNKQRAARRNLSGELAQLDRVLATLESRRKYRCVWIRNEYIKKRIRKDFTNRQKKLCRLVGNNKHKYDGSVEVFPVCATAFRDLLKDDKPMLGFPSELYTGVPRLRQWLGESVLLNREEHLNSVLRGLQRLYDGIRRWSDDNSRGMVTFSRQDIESLLHSSHEKYRKKIGGALSRSASELQQLTPFQNKSEKIGSCRKVATQAACRWVYKFPDEPNPTTKMTWLTYDAIIKRNGGPFQSIGEKLPLYDFPSTLGAAIMSSVVLDDWLKFFQDELPKNQGPLMVKAGDTFRQYMEEVKGHLSGTAPGIVPYFDGTASTMNGIETELCDKIKASIKEISDGASRIHPLFVNTLREKLHPVFEDALKIRGKGHFKKRQAQLNSDVGAKCGEMVAAGYTRMENAYNSRISALPQEFEAIANSAVSQVQTQIGLLLNNLQAVSGKDHTALDKKKQLQKTVRKSALVWEAQWRTPKDEVVVDETEPLDIPKEFVERFHKVDGSSDSNSEPDSDSDSDGDSDSESGDEDVKMED